MMILSKTESTPVAEIAEVDSSIEPQSVSELVRDQERGKGLQSQILCKLWSPVLNLKEKLQSTRMDIVLETRLHLLRSQVLEKFFLKSHLREML